MYITEVEKTLSVGLFERTHSSRLIGGEITRSERFRLGFTFYSFTTSTVTNYVRIKCVAVIPNGIAPKRGCSFDGVLGGSVGVHHPTFSTPGAVFFHFCYFSFGCCGSVFGYLRILLPASMSLASISSICFYHFCPYFCLLPFFCLELRLRFFVVLSLCVFRVLVTLSPFVLEFHYLPLPFLAATLVLILHSHFDPFPYANLILTRTFFPHPPLILTLPMPFILFILLNPLLLLIHTFASPFVEGRAWLPAASRFRCGCAPSRRGRRGSKSGRKRRNRGKRKRRRSWHRIRWLTTS